MDCEARSYTTPLMTYNEHMTTRTDFRMHLILLYLYFSGFPCFYTPFPPLVLSTSPSLCSALLVVSLLTILAFRFRVSGGHSVWRLSHALSAPLHLYAHNYVRTYAGRRHILLELISLVVAYHRTHPRCTPILVARGR